MAQLQCPKGEELSQGACWPVCKSGYTGAGATCYLDCPKGFNDLGPVCGKPSMPRSVPQVPVMAACPSGTRDDGSNCWADQACAYVPTPDRTGYVLKCTGCGCITMTRAERQKCPNGYTLQDNMCYVKCPSGYTASTLSGSTCVANCPPGFTEAGSGTGSAAGSGSGTAHCVKPTTTRAPGSIRGSGLKRITDDPRRSTLVERLQVGRSPNQANADALINRLGGGGGLGPTLGPDSITQGLGALRNSFGSFCSGDSWLDADTWFKLGILVAVVAALIFLGPAVGKVVSAAAGFVAPAAAGIGQAAGDIISTGADIVTKQADDALNSVTTNSLRDKVALNQQLAKALSEQATQAARLAAATAGGAGTGGAAGTAAAQALANAAAAAAV